MGIRLIGSVSFIRSYPVSHVLGQSHDRHQTGMCHEPVVVERDLHRLGPVSHGKTHPWVCGPG